MEQIPQMEVIKRKQNSSIMLDSVKREEHLTSANETEDHVFKVKKEEEKQNQSLIQILIKIQLNISASAVREHYKTKPANSTARCLPSTFDEKLFCQPEGMEETLELLNKELLEETENHNLPVNSTLMPGVAETQGALDCQTDQLSKTK